MPHENRSQRVQELRLLVQTGQYEIDSKEVAAALIRKTETSRKPESPKVATSTSAATS